MDVFVGVVVASLLITGERALLLTESPKRTGATAFGSYRACSNERSLSSPQQPIVTEGFTIRLVVAEYKPIHRPNANHF